jgi:hypothetical protein
MAVPEIAQHTPAPALHIRKREAEGGDGRPKSNTLLLVVCLRKAAPLSLVSHNAGKVHKMMCHFLRYFFVFLEPNALFCRILCYTGVISFDVSDLGIIVIVQ